MCNLCNNKIIVVIHGEIKNSEKEIIENLVISTK